MDFMPVFGVQFFTTFALNRFLYLKGNILASLTDNEVLGPHTDIMAFEYEEDLKKTGVKTYVWSNPGIKPFGKSLTQQCQSCKVLRPWKPTLMTADKITVECKSCKIKLDYFRGDKLSYGQSVSKMPYGGKRGEWLYEVVVDPAYKET